MAMIGLMGYLVYSDPQIMRGPSIVLVGAALAFLTGNFDRIEVFKAGMTGFEARTREARAVVDQATATASSLHELAVATAAFQVEMLAASGRFGGAGTVAEKDEQKAKLIDRLTGLGLTIEQLNEVEGADKKWVMVDYTIEIIRRASINSASKKLDAFRKSQNEKGAFSPEECKKMLIDLHVDDNKTQEILADYEYYHSTGKQRRPEIWRDRGNWRNQ